MARDEVRRQCEELVSRLNMPVPFDLDEFVGMLGRERGRPIHLIAREMPAGVPSGLMVSMEDADYVLYERRAQSLHRTLIILHEIGHCLLPGPDGEGEGGHACPTHVAAGQEMAVTLEVARSLLPTLDPQVVLRTLGRTSYGLAEERAAELFATLVLERAQRLPSTVRAAPSDSTAIGRVEGSLQGRHR